MPQSFIFQQAMALDQEELEERHIEDENKGILHVCFSENGPEVPLIVNINELRRLAISNSSCGNVAKRSSDDKSKC
jgi:hypothetical protein